MQMSFIVKKDHVFESLQSLFLFMTKLVSSHELLFYEDTY